MNIYQKIRSRLPAGLKKVLRPLYFSAPANRVRRILHRLIILQIYNRGYFEQKENFLRLHLFCGEDYFPEYINIDRKKTRATDYVCPPARLPFPYRSVERIETYSLPEHLSPKELVPVLKEWWRVLIPGGVIVIECSEAGSRVDGLVSRTNQPDPAYILNELKMILEEHGYRGVRRAVPRNYHQLPGPRIRIEAYKSISLREVRTSDQAFRERKERSPESYTLEWRKEHIYSLILDELKPVLFEGKKAISLGCGTGELELLLGREGYDITGVDHSSESLAIAREHKQTENRGPVRFVRASILHLPFSDHSFDSSYAVEVFEHIEPDQLGDIFLEIKRVLKADARSLITVPDKYAYFDPGHRQFFTSGILAELLDKHNIAFEWIELEEREDRYQKHNMLKALLINRPAFTITRSRKICALGVYEHMRYNQLGFHSDGPARAFRQLGYKTLLLDIRKDKHYPSLRAKIREFEPNILWLEVPDGLPFLQWMAEDIKELRRKGGKVVYWFGDLRKPRPMELGGLIDVMFLTNAGQIEEYRKAYGIEKVHYMPQACTPAFMHRLDLPEIYNIGFTSSLAAGYHNKRMELLRKLTGKYDVIIKNDIRNTIANFYSRCRIVLGFNPHFMEYLYTSNRLFVALGCGAFYLCQWFPGIERLAANHKHLVWFQTEKELFDLIDYYLEHNEERETIRKNAQELAHIKHTYRGRIQNMLDIIDGKTADFYGFLRDGEG